MDNFGIFKLLSSFYNYVNQKKSEEKTSDSNSLLKLFSQNPIEKATAGTSENSAEKTVEKPVEKPPVTASVKKENSPLVTQMLSTIKSHDEFVKRVLENNPTPK